MANDTLSTIQHTLKQQIEPEIQKQIDRAHVFFQVVRRDTENIRLSGQALRYYITEQTARVQGVGVMLEAGAYPTPRAAAFAQQYADLSRMGGSILVSGDVKTASGGNHALADVVANNIKDLLAVMKDEAAAHVAGDGSGALARIQTVTSGTVLTLYRNNLSPGSRHLEEGMRLDSYTVCTAAGKQAGGTIAMDSKTISSVDSATQITLDATTSAVADDYLFREDTYGTAWMGVVGIIDDGTYQATFQGATRSTTGYANATVLTNPDGAGTVRDLTEDLMIQACDEASYKGGKPTMIYTTPAVRREYFALLAGDRRFTGAQTKNLPGGFTAMTFSCGQHDLDWTVDEFARPGSIFVFNPANWRIAEAEKLHWDTGAGETAGPLYRVQGYNKYQADAIWKWQLVALKVRGACVIRDLRVT